MIRIAARLLSALLVATLVAPALEVAPVAAASATHFSVTGFDDPATAGVQSAVTVTALDGSDAIDTTYAGTVTITSSDGAVVLPADATLTNGVGTFDVTLKTAGSQDITATDTVDSSITGAQIGITVDPAAATSISLGAYPDPTVVGVAHTVSVTAHDAFNNVATGYTGTVTVTTTDPANVVTPASYTFTGGDGGTSDFSVKFNTVGVWKLTADDGTNTANQPNINAIAAAATHLDVTGFTSPTVAGAAHTFIVTARDQFDNIATGYTGTVHFTSSDPFPAALPSNYHFVAGDNGDHTFTNGATLKTAGTRSITATDIVTGSITGTQSAIEVDPGTATALVVEGFPDPTVSGVSHSFTVTATDDFGNTDPTYIGTVHFTSTDGGASLPSDYDFVGGDNGVKTFSATLATGGDQSITATDTVTSSITGTQGAITVNGAGATHLVVSGYPATTAAGQPHTFTVMAKDGSNNTDTSFAGTVHFTSTDSFPAGLPADYTFVPGDNGVHTFSATFKTAGDQDLTATDTVTSSITGTQSNITVNPGAATHLAVGGFSASVIAGTQDGFSVTALDAFGNTATGYTGTVHFSSNDPFPAALPSNYHFLVGDAGFQTFQATLKTVGTLSITATDTVTASIFGTQPGIVVTPAGADHLVVTGFPSPTTAGAAHTVTVTARDAFNNTATGYTGTVHFTSTDGAATLPGDYTFVGGDSGAHSFSNAATLQTTGTQSIAATDTVTSSITGTQPGIVVNSAGADHLVVSGYNDPTIAGASDFFTVTAQDAFNNTVTGYVGRVHFTSTDSFPAGLPADYTFVPGDNGVHTFSATFKTAGDQDLTATDTVTSSITGTQSNITVNPGAATHLAVGGFTTPTTAGASHNISVTALDAFGNTATGYTGTVHFSSNDPFPAALPSNYHFLVGDAGFQTFQATLKTVGTLSITATDTVTASIFGTQPGIVVTPAGADHLVVTGFPSPTTAGAAHTVTVTARDAFNNTATGYTGTVHFTSTDGAATLPGDYTFVGGDSGAHSFSNAATLQTTGTQSIAATDTVTSSITGTQPGIVVNSAGADHLVVSGYNDPTIAGASDFFTVTAQDAFNNTVTGYVGRVHFTSTDSFPAGLPADYTFVPGDNGVHTFSATFKTAGDQDLTATDTVTSSITGTQSNITVQPAPASHFLVAGFPASTTAGVSHGFTVTALDPFGNTDTNYDGMVQFTSSDSQAVLPGDSTLTNGIGSFTAMLKTGGTQSITGTDSAASIVTGAQTGISVTPAGADHFVVAGFPSPTTANAPHTFTVTAQDAFNNTVSAYAGTVHFTSSDGAAVLPADYTFVVGDAGVHTFINGATLETASPPPVALTATDTVTTSITGTQSNVAVHTGPPDHIVVSPKTPSSTAGVAVDFTAIGFDAGNNSLGDFTSQTAFTIAGGSCLANACQAATVGAHLVSANDSGLLDTATLTITNTNPVAVDDSLTVLEDAAATPLTVLTNDSDVNLDTLTVSSVTQGSLGGVTHDATTVTYTPNVDANGTDTFTYTVDDGNGGTNTATVHVTITAVNDAPTITVPAAAPTIPEQSGVNPQTVPGFATGIARGPGTAVDEVGQLLTLTASNNTPGLFSTQPAIDKATGNLTYTPAVNRNGTSTVTVTLKDDGGTANGGVDTTIKIFTITVTGSDHPPVALNDVVTVVAGSPATPIDVLTNDNFNNLDQGEVLKIASVTQGVSGGLVTITGGGTGLTYRPKAGWNGTDFFTYKIKDALHTSASATVIVRVPRDTYGPTSTAPTQSVAAGGVLGTSTAVMRIAWGGSDLGVGVSRFELWQSVDGHGYTRISVTTARSVLANVAIAHRYRFRVRGIDKLGNVGAFAYGTTFTPHLTQETGASFSAAQWYLSNSSSYSGGHERRTSILLADATFTTTTQSFSWIGARGPNRGTADVYIDGALTAHVNTGASAIGYKFVFFTYNFATTGTHTIHIVYTGPPTKSVDVDAFVTAT